MTAAVSNLLSLELKQSDHNHYSKFFNIQMGQLTCPVLPIGAEMYSKPTFLYNFCASSIKGIVSK